MRSVAHKTDIFSLAVTPKQILSASGSSSLKIHSTTEPDFPISQSLDGAHILGCHHVTASKDGHKLASAGFGGEVKIWNKNAQDQWVEEGQIVGAIPSNLGLSEARMYHLIANLVSQMATKLERYGR
jgi:WD40 repeat protein